MLVLTRRVGEKILIGDDVDVMITQIKGGNVRIGIKAPDETKIRRAEIEGKEELEASNEM